MSSQKYSMYRLLQYGRHNETIRKGIQDLQANFGPGIPKHGVWVCFPVSINNNLVYITGLFD